MAQLIGFATTPTGLIDPELLPAPPKLMNPLYRVLLLARVHTTMFAVLPFLCCLGAVVCVGVEVTCDGNQGFCNPTQRDCMRERDDELALLRDINRGCWKNETYYRLHNQKVSDAQYRNRLPCPCAKGFLNDIDNLNRSAVRSRPVNLTVIRSPIRDRNVFNINVTWEDEYPDTQLTDYEVMLYSKYRTDSNFDLRGPIRDTCTCTKLRQWNLSNIKYTQRNTFKVRVIATPYHNNKEDCSDNSLTFDASEERDQQLINPRHCGGSINDVITSVQSSWISSGNRLQLTWQPPTSDKRVYFITLVDPSISSTPNCHHPGGSPPCFITNDTNVTVYGLDPTREYSVNVDSYTDVCEGLKIVQLYPGCGKCCEWKTVPAMSVPLVQEISTVLPSPEVSTIIQPFLLFDVITVQPSPFSRTPVIVHSSSTGPSYTPAMGTGPSYTPAMETGPSYTPAMGSGPSYTHAMGPGPSYTHVVGLLFPSINHTMQEFSLSRYRVRVGTTSPPRASVAMGSDSSETAITQHSQQGVGTSNSQNNIGTVLGPTVAGIIVFIAVVILVVLFVLIMRRRGQKRAHNEHRQVPRQNGGETKLSMSPLQVNNPVWRMGITAVIDEVHHPQMDIVVNGMPATPISPSFTPETSPGLLSDAPPSEKLPSTPDSPPPSTPKSPLPSIPVSLSTTRESPTHSAAALSPPNTLTSATITPSFRVLVIYSDNSPSEQHKVILQRLLYDLRECGIHVTSHECGYKGSLPRWIEGEVEEATAVLCVCNREFKQEWDGEASSSCRVVFPLRQLVYGTLSQGKELSKFAVVLMKQSDRQFIPSPYLQNTPLLVTEVEQIARFVKEIPLYTVAAEQNAA